MPILLSALAGPLIGPRKDAKKRDADAQSELGERHEKGEGVTKDRIQAQLGVAPKFRRSLGAYNFQKYSAVANTHRNLHGLLFLQLF